MRLTTSRVEEKVDTNLVLGIRNDGWASSSTCIPVPMRDF